MYIRTCLNVPSTVKCPGFEGNCSAFQPGHGDIHKLWSRIEFGQWTSICVACVRGPRVAPHCVVAVRGAGRETPGGAGRDGLRGIRRSRAKHGRASFRMWPTADETTLQPSHELASSVRFVSAKS